MAATEDQWWPGFLFQTANTHQCNPWAAEPDVYHDIDISAIDETVCNERKGMPEGCDIASLY